jgi:hypothetical protein
MNKRIIITIKDDDGNNEQVSAFSNNKIDHITNTKQWEYVLNAIIDNFNKGFEKDGVWIMNPDIPDLD